MNRRNFIQTSAIVGSSVILPFSAFGKNGKIKLVVLGTGWWATDYLIPNILATGNFEIAALCDVNSDSLKNAANAVQKETGYEPKLFSDYQKMFEMPNLQAVVIATPTHWHAVQFIDACKAGLHVFLEKPVSYDIRESQAMIEAHKKANNVVQVDFPRVLTNVYNQVKAFIKSGEAGKIFQVQANIHNTDGRLIEKPIPPTIDFEKFCGPAPMTRYLCSENGNKPNWRGQHDFSRGVLMDWGIHYIHNIRKILDLDIPDSVSSIGGITKNFTQDNPDHLDVRFDFGGLPVNWTHKSWGFTSVIPDHNIGVYYFGEKATIFAGDMGWEIYPAGEKEKITHGDVRFRSENPDHIQTWKDMIAGMFNEFADGIRNNSNLGISNSLQDAAKTTSAVIYADLSYQVKSEINIDKATMTISNNERAQSMLKRNYRNNYKHPYNA
jgi:predicted dehydrogenase